MAGWTTQKELLRMEIKQREEEGCDVRGFADESRLGADPAAVESLYDELMALPIAPDFPYEEPQTLEGIRAARPAHAVFPKPASPIAQDRFLGAWLGRACGCALGKPVETGCFMGGKDGVRGWELVKRWFRGRRRLSHPRLHAARLPRRAGPRASHSRPGARPASGRPSPSWSRTTTSATQCWA